MSTWMIKINVWISYVVDLISVFYFVAEAAEHNEIFDENEEGPQTP